MQSSELAAISGAPQQAMAQLSRQAQKQTSREVEQVVGRAIVTDVHEQGRAHLANAALQNVGALSAFEQHLAQTVPGGAARYAAIVNAYTAGASSTLLRW